MSQRQRIILALVLVAGGLAYLIGTAVSNTTMYYLTVDEALAKELTTPAAAMRLNGDIQEGTISWSPKDLRLAFSVEGESGGAIPAVYHGPRPDNFEPGVPAILEGHFNEDGVFQVQKLMLACPSRFTKEGEDASDVYERDAH